MSKKEKTMKSYTVSFSGEKTVEAKDKEDALEVFSKLEDGDYDDFQVTDVDEVDY